MSLEAEPLKLAMIAGEKSGDLLGADLIAALKHKTGAPLELVGVGGDAMAAEGLHSLFDYEELSIVGFSAVIARLPQLLMRIRNTARAIVAAQPDGLIIIDSPDFTHRVARAVHRAMPDLPIINYVCPTVWAWKPERAARMAGYIRHVLSVFPFEPDIVARLGGPPVTYVGHRLMSDPGLAVAIAAQRRRRPANEPQPSAVSAACCLLLPGSRAGEIRRLLPAFGEAAAELAKRRSGTRFVLPTLPRFESEIRAAVRHWGIEVEVTTGEEAKWQAFLSADAALAASGTVLLELALAGVPCVSTYKLDPVAKLMMRHVNAWTVALPNFIADYPIINEYINESVRPGLLARRLENLIADSSERHAMLAGFDRVRTAMETQVPAGEHAAEIVLQSIGR